MELRPYQQHAFTGIMTAMQTERYILCQAATGAGKTILFSHIIRHCMEHYRMRIGILAHREILVRQAQDKLLKVWPDGEDEIGLACASVSHDVQLWRPVVIGSPQTLARRLNSMPPLNLVIIDECHRLPPRNEKSQYRTLLEAMEERYPKLRVLGVTATPYRLGHGYIFGEECRPGKENWFGGLHCQVSIAELQAGGYLVPLRARQAEDVRADLSSVSTSKGEYNQTELSDVMEREVHLQSAVHAYQQYGEGREHVVAFCVTIKHAEKLSRAFRAAGISATVIHSEMKKEDREAAMQDFEEGRCRVICNVGVLTEGWDCTAVDCILFCRPTMSPALYVQMVGRGLRTHPGKKDCLLLDLSGNCMRHGDVNDPLVIVPRQRMGRQTEEEKKDRMKECPNCGELFTPKLKVCPACGWAVPVTVLTEKQDVELHEIDFGRSTVPAKIISWRLEDFTSRAGNRMARLSMLCSAPDWSSLPVLVNQFFDFAGSASAYGKSRARMDWVRLAGTVPPSDTGEAVARTGELHLPDTISIKRSGQYFNVARWSA